MSEQAVVAGIGDPGRACCGMRKVERVVLNALVTAACRLIFAPFGDCFGIVFRRSRSTLARQEATRDASYLYLAPVTQASFEL